MSFSWTLRRLVTSTGTITGCQTLLWKSCPLSICDEIALGVMLVRLRLCSMALNVQALPFILKFIASICELHPPFCFYLKLQFWFRGGANYRGGAGQAERGRRKKEANHHVTKQVMEDDKEAGCPEVWFDFHNEYLPSCFALCTVYLNFRFISRPTDTINFKPSLISVSQDVLS